MKARVISFLNIRTRVPQILPDNNPEGLFLSPGDAIDIAETVAGDVYKEISDWYKLTDGTFVWSGGVDLITEPVTIAVTPGDYFNLPFISDKMSWAHKYLDIPFIWKDIQTAGRNVVVGIVDLGIDTTHSDLNTAFLKNSIHILNDGSIDDSSPLNERIKDNVGHGTEMSGIIAAHGNLVYGIAPECKLLIAKIDKQFGITSDLIAKAIHFFKTNNVDIISASLIAPDSDALRTVVQECLDNNIAVIAAIGDNGLKDFDVFPACYKGCIAVGSFDENKKRCSFSNQHTNLALLAPGDRDNMLTTGLNNTKKLCAGETSIATAITAGCFALITSMLKQKNRIDLKQKALDILLRSCDDMGTVIGHDPENGFGRINLRNAISEIKTLL